MYDGETVKQNALLLNQVNGAYVDFYNSFFNQKLSDSLSFDYDGSIEYLSVLDEKLIRCSSQLANGSTDYEPQYNDLIIALNRYCDIIRKSVQLMKTVLQKLKERANGDLKSYSLNQYNLDVKTLSEYEKEKGQIGTQLNRLYNSAFRTNTAGRQPTKTKRGCYVATCVYGSYDCPQVWTLRRYRDFYLSKTWYGSCFIKLYYSISPFIVRCFGNKEWFQIPIRKVLDKMVVRLKECPMLSSNRLPLKSVPLTRYMVTH